MSEPEKFLDRWSRRKREAADESAPVEAKQVAGPVPPPAEAKEAAAEVPFDPASLPPIESITAESDIRAFLKPGVPSELTRAALRRAWSADPAICDFIGLVENPGDFNDPHGVLGFGPMPAGGDVGRLLAQAIGAPLPEEPGARQQIGLARGNSGQGPAPATDLAQAQQLPQDQLACSQDLAAPEKDFAHSGEDDVAARNASADGEGLPASGRRGHGGALPK